ncbi:transmembrane emp24 domain-containing protein 6-like [Hypomesus transpacificus]|uniref:transmembrane emp24 domain-containing protein 6-like n=1 Tax=Hypomesus transpacificus TaxID=137520 RepID=UPI001F087CE9|nr:transmembrane emp24 domain-containing protein 6-like [Hypomesus transpacificus]
MIMAMWCWLLCAVLLVLPGQAGGEEPFPNPSDQSLFWGADQYDFSIVVPAAGLECFWHFAHHGERFYLTFMVQWVTGVGHDRHLSVTVNAPSSLIVGQADDAQGQISFAAEETGFYQMCFSNFHNRFGSMQVFLDFGVYYEGQTKKEEEAKTKEEHSRDLNSTLSSIVGTSHRVENYVFHMFRHYNFGRMRRGKDFYLLLSNNTYVTWWSAAQSVVIVLAGYLQLLFLKRLFHTKNTTETEKPRC